MDLRTMVVWLVAVALILPVVIVVSMGMSRLLAVMGDTAGGLGMERAAAVAVAVWVVDLVALVVVLGLERLSPPDE